MPFTKMAATKKRGGLKVIIKLGNSNLPGRKKRSTYTFAAKTAVSSKLMRCVRCNIAYQTPDEFEEHLLSHIYTKEKPYVSIYKLTKNEIREWTKIRHRQKRRYTATSQVVGKDQTKNGTRMRLRRINKSKEWSVNGNCEVNNPKLLVSSLVSETSEQKLPHFNILEQIESEIKLNQSNSVETEENSTVENANETAIKTLKNKTKTTNTAIEIIQTVAEEIADNNHAIVPYSEPIISEPLNSNGLLPQVATITSRIDKLPDLESSIQPLVVKSISVLPTQFTQTAANQCALICQNTLVQKHTTVLHQNMYIQQNWMPTSVDSVILPVAASSQMVMPDIQNSGKIIQQQPYTLLTSALNSVTQIQQQQSLNPQLTFLQQLSNSQLVLSSQLPNSQLMMASQSSSDSQLLLPLTSANPRMILPKQNSCLALPQTLPNGQVTMPQQTDDSQQEPVGAVDLVAGNNSRIMEVSSSATATLKAYLPFGYKCSLCHTQCMTKVELDLHILSHEGSHLTCNICGHILKDYNAFKEHRLVHQAKSSNGISDGQKENRLLPNILRRPISISQPENAKNQDDSQNTMKLFQTVKFTIQNIEKQIAADMEKIMKPFSNASSISTIPITSNRKDVSITPTSHQKKTFTAETIYVQQPPAVAMPSLQTKELTITSIQNNSQSNVTGLGNFKKSDEGNLNISVTRSQDILPNKLPTNNVDTSCQRQTYSYTNRSALPPLVPARPNTNAKSYQRLAIRSQGLLTNHGNYQEITNNTSNYQKLSTKPRNYSRSMVNTNPYQKLVNTAGNYQSSPNNSGNYQRLPNSRGNYQKLPHNSEVYQKPANNQVYLQPYNNNAGFSNNILLPGNKRFSPYPIRSQSSGVAPVSKTQMNRLLQISLDRTKENTHLQQQLMQLPIPRPRQQNIYNVRPQQSSQMEQSQQIQYSSQRQPQHQAQNTVQKPMPIQSQQQHQAPHGYYSGSNAKYSGSNTAIRSNTVTPQPAYPTGSGQSVNVENQASYQYLSPHNNLPNSTQYNAMSVTSGYQQITSQWHQPQNSSVSLSPPEISVLMPPPSQPPPRFNRKYPTNTSESMPYSMLQSSRDVESLTCGICSKGFLTLEELSCHLVTHTNDCETDNSSSDIVFSSKISFSPMPIIEQEKPPTPPEFEEENDFGFVISSVRTLSEDQEDSNGEPILTSENSELNTA